MNYGFFRTAVVSLKLKVANPSYNKVEIINCIEDAVQEKAKLLITPELSITGYTCADLFFSNSLYNDSLSAIQDIVNATKNHDIVVVVGAPIRYLNSLYNCAVLISNGKILGIVPKIHLANYNEYYEKRWFASGADFKKCEDICFCSNNVKIGPQIFNLGNDVIMGIELCEDLWVPNPPSTKLTMQGANIIANLSASDEYVTKAIYRRDLIKNQSARCISAYLYSSSSVSESTTDLLFGGSCFIAENGSLLKESERFNRNTAITYADIDIEKLNHLRISNTSFSNLNEDIYTVVSPINNRNNDLKYVLINKRPFVPSSSDNRSERCKEILSIQSNALATRIEHVGSSGVVIGLSGGLDSTLALIVCCISIKMLGKNMSDILCVTMPGFGTSSRTYSNAVKLAESLGVTLKDIDIKGICQKQLELIEHDEDQHDVTYENVQARERTEILFNLANEHNKLLVGTGDLSELALGWCTYNADHMSMYGVNASVPKTLVRYIIKYISDKCVNDTVKSILNDILLTPVSPELLPNDKNGDITQKTEESIGSYDLHDFFLYNFIRFGYSKDKLYVLACKAFKNEFTSDEILNTLNTFLKRFFNNQFKRSCVPDSPKVGSVSLSPRGDWRMPSDACVDTFLK